MARPLKQGIDYFSLDVDFLKDLKVKKIVRGCGAIAPVILISLLSNIYRDYGYYVGWDKDMPFLVADEVGASEGAVDEVVRKATLVGFFDERLFEEYAILTSRGIQKRFLAAAYKRTRITLVADYCLIDVNEKIFLNKNVVFDNRNIVFDSKNPVSDIGNPQSKVKNSKVKNKNLPETAGAVAGEQIPKKYDKEGIPYKCSKFLADKILQVNPGAKVPKDDEGLYKWCVHIDRLLRIDGKPPDELRDVLAFAVKDQFWQANILSTKNFREKYDKLYMKMANQGGAKHSGTVSGSVRLGEPDPYDRIKSSDF